MTFSIADDVSRTLAALQSAFTCELIEAVDLVAQRLEAVLRNGGKILIMGNGGSAADAQHIAAELVGRYKIERRGLAAIALTTDSSVLTAWSNDYCYSTVFSRQVEALMSPGDAVWGISTSGNSENVIRALTVARNLGGVTIGLLGRDGGALKALCDLSIIVPLEMTDQIQTAHMVVYHSLCGHLDESFR